MPITSIFSNKYKFDQPVALYFWRPIEDALRDLNDDISQNYKDLAGATGSAHTGKTKWAECITSALNSVTSATNDILFERAKYARAYIAEALKDLDGRFAVGDLTASSEENSYKNPTYIDYATQTLELKTKILECQKVVVIYCEYCTTIEPYVTQLKKWESCDLYIYLQNKFTKETARNICKELGAISREQLGYIGVSIEKSKFDRVTATPPVNGVRASLLELRACLEASEYEE